MSSNNFQTRGGGGNKNTTLLYCLLVSAESSGPLKAAILQFSIRPHEGKRPPATLKKSMFIFLQYFKTIKGGNDSEGGNQIYHKDNVKI